MSRDSIRFLYLVVWAAIVWWLLLSIFASSGRAKSSRSLKLGWGIIALFVAAGSWQSAYGVWTNPSLPFVGLIFAGLAERVFGIAWLRPNEWRDTWVFGAVAGTALYLHPVLFAGMDLYYWGWEAAPSAFALGILGVTFLAAGQRLGVFFLVALIAYAFGTLESDNCWDYVVDPFFWLISVGVLGKGAIRSFMRRLHPRPPHNRGSEAGENRPHEAAAR